jgi:CMP/dCMP kinase
VTVVAIDGPAGAGKSTVARAVAGELGFTYLDTGAMYRTVALAAAEHRADPAAVASTLKIEVQGGRMTIDGRDVSDDIRTPAVSEAASRAAADPEVRRAVVEMQRRLLRNGDWVAEGRDIGTVVAPDAEVKVFLTADPEERARRRAAELGLEPARVLAEQAIRDERDRTREHSPLAAAADAVVLDSTEMTLPEVVQRIAALVDGTPVQSLWSNDSAGGAGYCAGAGTDLPTG